MGRRGDKPQKKKSRIPGIKGPQNVGWGEVNSKGRYKRKNARGYSKVDLLKDAQRISEHKPPKGTKIVIRNGRVEVRGKPFAGDAVRVYYIVNKETGKPAVKKIYFRKEDIPRRYRNSKKYEIRVGWV